MTESQRDPIKLAIFGMIIAVVIGTVFSWKIQGTEEFVKINFGEFSLTMATFALAIFTYYLAKSEVEESRMRARSYQNSTNIMMVKLDTLRSVSHLPSYTIQ